MYCPNCGSQNTDQATFCVNCGNALKSTAGNATPPTPPPAFPPNPPQQPGYQQPYGQQRPAPEDKVDTILSILAFCFPIVGLILYFVWKDNRPNSAKQICTVSAIGFGVGVVFYLIMAAGASLI